ncbi:uncharacterized protein LOC128216658 [Mya arenaria]|uniref:uncharacterized protein LOC128216658 n=1 Tax=Mya arenaria TaxID=6604 RepID=UPI0022E02532|nr:uncharacterized protein LOC128216658 [Mya arenaria]
MDNWHNDLHLEEGDNGQQNYYELMEQYIHGILGELEEMLEEFDTDKQHNKELGVEGEIENGTEVCFRDIDSSRSFLGYCIGANEADQLALLDRRSGTSVKVGCPDEQITYATIGDCGSGISIDVPSDLPPAHSVQTNLIYRVSDDSDDSTGKTHYNIKQQQLSPTRVCNGPRKRNILTMPESVYQCIQRDTRDTFRGASCLSKVVSAPVPYEEDVYAQIKEPGDPGRPEEHGVLYMERWRGRLRGKGTSSRSQRFISAHNKMYYTFRTSTTDSSKDKSKSSSAPGCSVGYLLPLILLVSLSNPFCLPFVLYFSVRFARDWRRRHFRRAMMSLNRAAAAALLGFLMSAAFGIGVVVNSNSHIHNPQKSHIDGSGHVTISNHQSANTINASDSEHFDFNSTAIGYRFRKEYIMNKRTQPTTRIPPRVTVPGKGVHISNLDILKNDRYRAEILFRNNTFVQFYNPRTGVITNTSMDVKV